MANPPNSAQLGGRLYHASKLHPGPCSSVGVRPRTDTQTDRHIDARDRNTFCVVYDSRKMQQINYTIHTYTASSYVASVYVVVVRGCSGLQKTACWSGVRSHWIRRHRRSLDQVYERPNSESNQYDKTDIVHTMQDCEWVIYIWRPVVEAQVLTFIWGAPWRLYRPHTAKRFARLSSSLPLSNTSSRTAHI